MASRIGLCYKFREFRLDTANPALWLEDRLVSLPPKAADDCLSLLAASKNGHSLERGRGKRPGRIADERQAARAI